jgi:hypothetical protein
VERDPFAFASVNARTVAEAKQARERLAARLGLGTDEIAILKSSPAWPALITFCVENPLNISWYDAKISAWQTRRSVFLISCVAVLVIVLVGLAQGGFAESRIAQVSAAIAVLGACLRILNSAADVRTQLGGFWKARADLKEAFLTFEQAWTGKVIVGGAVPETFETALWQEITNARHIVRCERDNYFSTFVATDALLTTATSGLGDVLGRGRELRELTLPAQALSTQLAAVGEARRKLDEAHADEVAQDRLLELLAKKPDSLDDDAWQKARGQAEQAKIAAATEVARYSELLKSLAKASTMNLR